MSLDSTVVGSDMSRLTPSTSVCAAAAARFSVVAWQGHRLSLLHGYVYRYGSNRITRFTVYRYTGLVVLVVA